MQAEKEVRRESETPTGKMLKMAKMHRVERPRQSRQ